MARPSNWGALAQPRYVVLPLVVPGLSAAGAKFAQDCEIQHGPMAAAPILATIPALVLMVFGQRFIVQGLTMGSMKQIVGLLTGVCA